LRLSHPDNKIHKFMNITHSGTTFVARGNDHSFEMNVYDKKSVVLSHEDDVDQLKIQNDKFFYQGSRIDPSGGLLIDGESKMLLTSSEHPTCLYEMDLNRETVVSKWDTQFMRLEKIIPKIKSQNQSDRSVLAFNQKGMLLMDTRLATSSSAVVSSKFYSNNLLFSSAATTATGQVAMGNKTGQIRFYDGKSNAEGNLKIAKTQIDLNKKENIIAVDVTADGFWIVATMKSCLAIFPTKLKDSEVSMFSQSLKKDDRPNPLYLTLSSKDILKHKIKDIIFTPAAFDESETNIVTSTGNIAVIWNFMSIKKAKPKYTLRFAPSYIKAVKSVDIDRFCVAYPQEVDFLTTMNK